MQSTATVYKNGLLKTRSAYLRAHVGSLPLQIPVAPQVLVVSPLYIPGYKCGYSRIEFTALGVVVGL